jgi:hypothetical protein
MTYTLLERVIEFEKKLVALHQEAATERFLVPSYVKYLGQMINSVRNNIRLGAFNDVPK